MEKKKKRDYRYLILIVLAILLGGIIFLYIMSSESSDELQTQTDTASTNSSSNSTTTSEANAEIKTIKNTISGSGEISTGLDEKIETHATYYLSEIYIEEQQTVLAGENILKYTNGIYLKAPYDCVIYKLSLPEVGSQCTSKHYVEIYALNNLLMKINVDEDEIDKVNVGTEVEVTLTAYENKTYTGYITKISNSGTYSSRGTTFETTVELENDGNIKIGMSASCEVIVEKAENVIAVPTEAVKTQSGQKYVVVVNSDGTTTNINIETGISTDAYTEVKSGLNGNETVQITKKTNTSTNGFGSGMQMDRSEFKGMYNGERPSGVTGGEMSSNGSKTTTQK